MDGEPTTPVHKKDSLLPNEQPRFGFVVLVVVVVVVVVVKR